MIPQEESCFSQYAVDATCLDETVSEDEHQSFKHTAKKPLRHDKGSHYNHAMLTPFAMSFKSEAMYGLHRQRQRLRLRLQAVPKAHHFGSVGSTK